MNEELKKELPKIKLEATEKGVNLIVPIFSENYLKVETDSFGKQVFWDRYHEEIKQNQPLHLLKIDLSKVWYVTESYVVKNLGETTTEKTNFRFIIQEISFSEEAFTLAIIKSLTHGQPFFFSKTEAIESLPNEILMNIKSIRIYPVDIEPYHSYGYTIKNFCTTSLEQNLHSKEDLIVTVHFVKKEK